MKRLFQIFALSLIFINTTIAQKPFYAEFTAGAAISSPGLPGSQKLQDFYTSRNYADFQKFASDADFQERFLLPQFSLNLIYQPYYKLPIYLRGGMYTSSYDVSEICFNLGGGVYYQKFLKDWRVRKFRYGKYWKIGGEYSILMDRGFTEGSVIRSLGNKEFRDDYIAYVGPGVPAVTYSDVVTGYLEFGRVSPRKTDMGLRVAYLYDYQQDKKIGRFDQFRLTLFARF